MPVSPDDFTLVPEDSVLVALSPSLGLPIEKAFRVIHREHGDLGRVIFHPDRTFITVIGGSRERPRLAENIAAAARSLLDQHLSVFGLLCKCSSGSTSR